MLFAAVLMVADWSAAKAVSKVSMDADFLCAP
jgi:hypothetical protein